MGNKKKNIDDPCVSNYRLARVNDKHWVKRYYLQQDRSCCGVFDVRKIGPDLRVYLIGCNYGH